MIQELPGGLIVEDIKVGEGIACPRNATVTIHYTGTLENGTQFDSSRDGKTGFYGMRPAPERASAWLLATCWPGGPMRQ